MRKRNSYVVLFYTSLITYTSLNWIWTSFLSIIQDVLNYFENLYHKTHQFPRTYIYRRVTICQSSTIAKPLFYTKWEWDPQKHYVSLSSSSKIIFRPLCEKKIVSNFILSSALDNFSISMVDGFTSVIETSLSVYSLSLMF